MEDLVMRSVYLKPSEDGQLRQLAHELSVTKSDLIRSAISTKLREWRESNSSERVMYDLQFGRREGAPDRAARVVADILPVDPPKMPSAAKIKNVGSRASRKSPPAPKPSSKKASEGRLKHVEAG